MVWVELYGSRRVYGRLYNSFAEPVASVLVSTGPASETFPAEPAVAMDDSDGAFVVVWSANNGETTYEAFGQAFDSVGTKVGGEFLLTSNSYDRPEVDIFLQSAGRFMAVWSEDLSMSGGPVSEIHAQVYDGNGDTVGSELGLVDTVFEIQTLAVAGQTNGDFVVAWSNYSDDADVYDVRFQKFASNGEPQTSAVVLNQIVDGDQGRDGIGVAADTSDDFLVVWSGQNIDSDRTGVGGRRINSGGVAVGGEFQVNTYEPADQGAYSGAKVAFDKGIDQFLVTWASGPGQDIDNFAVMAQRIATDGSPAGTEFQVNTYENYAQGASTTNPGGVSVASGDNGEFVVSWTSEFQDGFGSGIFGQRLGVGGD